MIVKNAVNYAYFLLFTRVFNKTKTASLAITDRQAQLPSDYYDIMNIKNSGNDLSDNEYEISGDIVFLSTGDLTGTLSLVYKYYPSKLTADGDVLELNDMYCVLASTYACYMYYMAKKKTDVAQLLYNEFLMMLQENVKEVSEDDIQRNL
jgi:hypothetical protein